MDFSHKIPHDVRRYGTNFSQVKLEDLRPLGGVISEPWVGKRLDQYLGACFPFLSRTAWQKRCLEGRVWVGERPMQRSSYGLRAGDQVYHLYPPHLEPWVNRDVFCFYRQGEVMGLYKPPHLPMHEGGSYRKNTFAEVLKESYGQEWGAVHRLDRETSGVVLCGSTAAVRAELSHGFRTHKFKKSYDAIVMGEVRESSWEVNAPIGYAQQSTWRCKRWVSEQGRVARTFFEVVEVISGFTRLKVFPEHGRTHQIRIHAAYSGYPLVGDTRYHPDERVFLEFIQSGYSEWVLEKIRAPRLCLHASSLELKDSPLLPHALYLPLPEDMSQIWCSLKERPGEVIFSLKI